MSEDPTTGQLYAGDINLYTVEKPWFHDAPNISCIPTGRYRLVLAWSNRYQKIMPRLLNVPGRDGILIHPGNTQADTHGCILVGSEIHGNILYWSRRAFDIFYEWLAHELRNGDVYISVENAAE